MRGQVPNGQRRAGFPARQADRNVRAPVELIALAVGCTLLAFTGCADGLTRSGATSSSRGVASQQIVRDEDRFTFEYRATMPSHTAPARAWIPLAQSNRFQDVRISRIEAPEGWKTIRDEEHGNTILFFEMAAAREPQPVRVTYEVTRREKRAYQDRSDPARGLKPERLVPQNQRFRQIAKEVTRDHKDDRARGRALYEHVLERMRYDKTGTGWGRGDANYACDARKGNCSDFHSYFIALARSIGIPARFAIGATIPADTDRGAIGGYHCWAEFLAGGRWIPVDLSEASKHPELADYYFGHHPANRFEFSTGRDLRTSPLPRNGPINFLAYPLIEAGGHELPATTAFSFERRRG